ncbi:c-type cytochrome [Kaistia nematophila]|uniref:Cytochrome c n=1 Tax=Kaistia nematophila TaxID=2994654 RepID=A0A9X3IPG4_9HYPH|nr:cytochrome c [Kaistia nematophila]
MRRPRRRAAAPAWLALALSGLIGAAAPGPAHAADADTIARGKYLAIASDCTACHTLPGGKPMAGGLPIETPIGAIIATNITPSKTAGIGNYTLDQFSAALRRGVRRDGQLLYPAMPYTAYAKLSDEDVAALYAYFMNSVEPVDQKPAETKLPLPFNIRLSMAAWNLLFLDGKPFSSDPSQSAEWNRGAYLVRGPAHCGTCHTPRNLLMAEQSSREMAGGDIGFWHAPNVTSDANSGIGGWSIDELVAYMRDGHASAKAQAGGPMAEAVENSLRFLTNADLRAIAVYLKSVPAIHDPADTRPTYLWGNPTDDLAKIRGVPLPGDHDQWSGAQIYDAYCASCHQDKGQGSFDGRLPSLLHNTALGTTNTNNVVAVILQGLRRQPDVLMPAFADALSDQQVATLGAYLIENFGNPAAKVTADQVKAIRAGAAAPNSTLILGAQIATVAAPLVVIALLLGWIGRRRSRGENASDMG